MQQRPPVKNSIRVQIVKSCHQVRSELLDSRLRQPEQIHDDDDYDYNDDDAMIEAGDE